MHWVSVGSTELLECEGCDGTWIEAGAFQRLCADRESQAAVLQKGMPEAKAAGPAGRVRYRPCPRCRKLMNRMNFGRLSGAIVDVCRGHGTFLDRGELRDVVRFILEGGLDRMRQAERDELKEEQRRLREIQLQQTHLAPTGPTPAWSHSSLQEFLGALFGRD
jgi:Zn-finger nucleic acid-binding protein